MSERTPREKETLMFATPEQASAWREDVGQKIDQQRGAVRQDREIVAEAVSQQFAQYGEAGGTISHPWEHTPAEHEEVQVLVDTAFAEDLPAALKLAKKSSSYPRNLDLLHDLLTSEMYDLVKEGDLGRQPLGLWITEVSVIILLAVLGVLLLLATALT
jgi:hypothetical protein